MSGALLNRHLPRLSASCNTLYRAVRLYAANGSPAAWLGPLKYLGRRTLGHCVPPFFTIAVTYRCPCRCQHCGVADRQVSRSEELDTRQFKSVIDQAKKLGVLQVTFTGGDPLLRDDLAELVRHAHSIGMLTRVNTCGMLMSRARADELKQAGLTQCAVSIDDADPAVHDRLRSSPGAFEKALAAMRRLRAVGILCQINTYAARRNVTQGLERIIALGRELGVLAVYIILPTAIGRWDGDFDQTLTEEEKAKIRALQETTFVHMELPTQQTLCGIVRKGVLFVSPRGDVTPCPFVPFIFGNVREHSVQDIWRRHCEQLWLVRAGDCPMNAPEDRRALQEHTRLVAGLLKQSE